MARRRSGSFLPELRDCLKRVCMSAVAKRPCTDKKGRPHHGDGIWPPFEVSDRWLPTVLVSPAGNKNFSQLPLLAKLSKRISKAEETVNICPPARLVPHRSGCGATASRWRISSESGSAMDETLCGIGGWQPFAPAHRLPPSRHLQSSASPRGTYP